MLIPLFRTKFWSIQWPVQPLSSSASTQRFRLSSRVPSVSSRSNCRLSVYPWTYFRGSASSSSASTATLSINPLIQWTFSSIASLCLVGCTQLANTALAISSELSSSHLATHFTIPGLWISFGNHASERVQIYSLFSSNIGITYVDCTNSESASEVVLTPGPLQNPVVEPEVWLALLQSWLICPLSW